MQLAHEVRREPDSPEVGVNRREHVAVAEDFLLVAITRSRLLRDEITDSLRRSEHALDAIRRLRALDHRRLPERLEHLRLLPGVELFLSAKLAENADRADETVRVGKPQIEPLVERSHRFVSFCCIRADPGVFLL